MDNLFVLFPPLSHKYWNWKVSQNHCVLYSFSSKCIFSIRSHFHTDFGVVVYRKSLWEKTTPKFLWGAFLLCLMCTVIKHAIFMLLPPIIIQTVHFLEAALFCLVIPLTSVGKSVQSEARRIYIFIETPGIKSCLLVKQKTSHFLTSYEDLLCWYQTFLQETNNYIKFEMIK